MASVWTCDVTKFDRSLVQCPTYCADIKNSEYSDFKPSWRRHLVSACTKILDPDWIVTTTKSSHMFLIGMCSTCRFSHKSTHNFIISLGLKWGCIGNSIGFAIMTLWIQFQNDINPTHTCLRHQSLLPARQKFCSQISMAGMANFIFALNKQVAGKSVKHPFLPYSVS